MNEVGLYSSEFEHDACGIGVLANIKGKKSNKIVKEALKVLINLDHRGARGYEENIGDGAGILIQIPHKFFKSQSNLLGFELPEEGDYGVAMTFFSPVKEKREQCQAIFEKIIREEGQEVIGYRDVPYNPSTLGSTAKDYMPSIRQIFIKKSEDVKRGLDFERKLYVIRKKVENEIKKADQEGQEYFYICSLSSNTIVYKGMLTPEQLGDFFIDLQDVSVVSAMALVHSRFSTNTFPSWERAHPNRYIIHNGEINTVRGNVNWMRAREASLETDAFGCSLESLFPIIDEEGSDSSMFDNCFEFLVLSGKSLAETMMMMVPEPWEKVKSIGADKKAFYQYHSCLMEPWDGPAAMAYTDGRYIGASLDRNGLRPSRYYITKDDMLILASEVGVVDVDEENIKAKQRLLPGKMLLVDTVEGRIISDEEIKEQVTKEKPYKAWVDKNTITLDQLDDVKTDSYEAEKTQRNLKVFGYTYEELTKIIQPMAESGAEPIVAMGNDVPLAVLSDKPQLLYNYFKQLFAQVTNPPLDAIREEIVTGSMTFLGGKGNLLHNDEEACKQIGLNTPLLYDSSLAKIKNNEIEGFKTKVIPILFDARKGERHLFKGLEKMFFQAEEAIEDGVNLIILSDKNIDENHAPIPALLAVAGMHHHLISKGIRTKASIIIESAEPREVHHFATLLGYGADAINPYMISQSIQYMIDEDIISDVDVETGVKNFMKASVKGVIKILSKMGISTIQSYRGAQIFEAVGISKVVIDHYFKRTPSRIGGIGLDIIAEEAKMRHRQGFVIDFEKSLDFGGALHWRKDGEKHLINPETITMLQHACKTGDYELFKDYAQIVNGTAEQHMTLRSMLGLRYVDKPINIEEVESVESICRRFKSGAMSYGSLSQEAHECLAIAMNRIGGKSNSGEGGENPERFIPLANGDSRCSAMKQVASGRFGVNSHYLVNAKEIQIKLAQGAKPGEGGHLPSKKVYPWIAEVRNSTPGVGLISPPPHHDIYSIEDLAQLIFDLKCANDQANINVKLVSEVGVGTIAAGVAKGHADVILISGYDGGTGAAPRTSVQHAGLPWELGLAETNQTLIMNNLRDRVKLETDGKLMTGRDILVAALLGAEEYNFSTLPLITMGCIMMRVCNKDTCPVGVATQNETLRKNFKGKPEYVVNLMTFLAQNLREEMAKIGIKSIDELIGRTDLLKRREDISHWKAKFVDLGALLFQPKSKDDCTNYCSKVQNHKLETTLDQRVLLNLCQPAIQQGKKVEANLSITNIDRTVGTMIGAEISRNHGGEGLEEDAITLNFNGSAGQSFGAFLPKGMTLKLEGDCNDYIGKGLSGGKIVVKPKEDATFEPRENIIVGNVGFYGATGGEAYIRGVAGERFCVRNSGVNAVVEGVGDHGCEYMTGGRVIVLGDTGKNFAAGMSGGVAFVYDPKEDFEERCNYELVDLEPLKDQFEVDFVKMMVQNHYEYTQSKVAESLLQNWDKAVTRFKKVIPRDYKRIIIDINDAKAQGMSNDEAKLYAFKKSIGQGVK